MTSSQILLANSSPAGLACMIDPSWRYPRHIRLLNHEVMSALRNGPRYLMVSMPPRHGKSVYLSKYLPAWFLGRYPEKHVLLGSYSADLAEDFSWSAREILKEYGKTVFGIEIDKTRASRKNWSIEKYGGGLSAAGRGGPFTGRGGHLVLLDDLIKNAMEALSPTILKQAWSWIQSTIITRMEPEALLIMVMTRWHENDPIGMMIQHCEEEDLDYRYINIPALAEEKDPLGRKPGEALWPTRFDEEALKHLKSSVGTYWWNAEYQGRPSPPEGAVFRKKWIRYYDILPSGFEIMIQSWDMSFKKTDEGSFVVGQVWGLQENRKYLVDQVRERVEFTEAVDMVRDLSSRYPEAKTKLIEEKANGSAVISLLKDEIGGFVPVHPEGSKEARARVVACQWERGDVFLPRHSSWKDDFIGELCSFPKSANDDQVDAMSQALVWLENFSCPEPLEIFERKKERVSMR